MGSRFLRRLALLRTTSRVFKVRTCTLEKWSGQNPTSPTACYGHEPKSVVHSKQSRLKKKKSKKKKRLPIIVQISLTNNVALGFSAIYSMATPYWDEARSARSIAKFIRGI